MRARIGFAGGLVAALTVATAGVATAWVAAAAPVAAAISSVPRPDHVVIVVEENRAQAGVIGNVNAPYITSLATQNANFTQSYAETHPSEPNYLALFSGSMQGLTDDSCPHTYNAPDLGSSLLSAGLGFTGYSESMPAGGYTGCASGTYARKHNPWVNFPAVPAASNQPFSAFPSDYSSLPAVSVVIPNLQDDMHDGTIAQGDAWLQNNMSGYIAWAKTHNSLFVLTFDEDDGSAANRIPTIMAGQRVVPGTYTETINHYNLLRTVTDAYGLAAIGNSATSTPIVDIWSPPAGDQPPTAVFTWSCPQLACTFDGGGSTDPDGTVTAWSWDFGDGTSGSGATPSHTYAFGGTFGVRVTVTDDQGATASVTNAVTVTAPGATPFAADAFARSVTNGWGTADVGGVYGVSGTAANFAVGGGAATMVLTTPGSTLKAYLSTRTSTDTDLTTVLSVDKVPVGGPVYPYVVGRRVSSGNEYDARVTLSNSQRVNLWLVRIVNGAETALTPEATVPGLLFSAGTQLAVRLQVVGTNPTTLRARIWPVGSSEPSGWNASTTDATAVVQNAGGVGISGTLSGKATNAPETMSVTSLVAKPTAAPANQPPTAAFTPTCTDLTCVFDGSASTDADGTITSYSWDFGDGATGTGGRPSHAYATAGTYTGKLTVTDNGGLSATVTHSVTVTATPPQPPTAAFTASCAQLMCNFDASTSTGGSGGAIASYAWDFGDSTAGSGGTPTHTFATGGTYPVVLTVTNTAGDTSTMTHSVTVTADAQPFALDQFNRTVTGGWGSADVGGGWSLIGGASKFSVSPGAASIQLPDVTPVAAYLGSATAPSSDVTSTVAVDKVPAGGPVYPYVSGRFVSLGNEYDARLTLSPTQRVNFWLVKRVQNAETPLTPEATVPGLTYSPGARLAVRIQVIGANPTTIRARVWPATGTEPSTWTVTSTDTSTALQAAGSPGLRCSLSSKVTNAPITLSVGPVVGIAPGPP